MAKFSTLPALAEGELHYNLAFRSVGRAMFVGALLSSSAPLFAQAGTTTPPTTEQTNTSVSAGQVQPGTGTLATPGAAAVSSDSAAQSKAGPRDSQVASPSSGQLGDIVVTATKRETNLQKTPIAISVVNTQALADRHIQSLIDLGDGSVPSLRVATFEARQSALTVGIRGIVPFDANQTARDQGVGVYLDGVYLGRQQGLNAALFDIDRIEVLKGPQGTLFGRNTEGGALSIVSKAPSGVFSGRVEGGVGNYGSYDSSAHIDLPAFGNLAIKIDGLIQHQDATTKNPLEGATGWNYYNRVGGRISARWKPTDALTIDLSADKAKDENTPFYSQLINYNPLGRTVGKFVLNPGTNKYVLVAPGTAAGVYTVCSTCIAPLAPAVVVSGGNRQDTAEIGVPQQPSVDRTQGFMGAIRYKVSPGLELRSITAYRKVNTEQWDNSGGAHRIPFSPNGLFSRYSLSDLDQHQFSQEFQAVGSLPSVDYVLGLYYFNEKATESAATPATNQFNVDGTGYTIISPVINGPVTSSNQSPLHGYRFLQRASTATAKSYSAYGQATYTPAGFDAFHLTVGGRYTKDKRNGLLYLVQNKPTNYLFNYSKGRFDPLVTAAFDVSPTVHVYAKYATGFRAGGANDRSQTFNAFGPEAVKSYEAGLKADLFDHRARLNLAGYIMNRTGTQIDFDNVDTRQFLADGITRNPTFNLHTEETRNAPGVSKIRGIEADLTVKPFANLTLSASYAYTYTRVPTTPNPFLNNIPYQVYVVYTPKHAASGAIDYEIPLNTTTGKVRFHLDANYASRQYSFQSEPVLAEPSFIMNGRISLADISLSNESQMTFAIWSRNLLNETHIYRLSESNNRSLGSYGNFNPPRTFGVEATVKFAAARQAMPTYVTPPPMPLPATQTCADGSVIAVDASCPVLAPPPPLAPPLAPPPSKGERG